MLFGDTTIVIRGGGDLGSGVAHQLATAGFPVIVLELAAPRAIRRAVSFATAVSAGSVTVDGVVGRLVESSGSAAEITAGGEVAVLVSDDLPPLEPPPAVVVDARMVKRNLDTTIEDAPLVVALGPGFTAGVDCDAVIETMRGHRLGRPLWEGSATPDSGTPGEIGGATSERVIRAGAAGPVHWLVAIGDRVAAGQQIGSAGGAAVIAQIEGVVRGLIAEGFNGEAGLKIADIDPRADRSACFEVSDKARLVGAGVLTAVLTWLNRR